MNQYDLDTARSLLLQAAKLLKSQPSLSLAASALAQRVELAAPLPSRPTPSSARSIDNAS